MALNRHGVVAAVLNRPGSLGPAAGKRSRGELPLLALEHRSATEAADAIAALDAGAWRSFNLVLADRRGAVFIRGLGHGRPDAESLAPGLHMVTAHDPDDLESPRVARHLARFQAAEARLRPMGTGAPGRRSWPTTARRPVGRAAQRGSPRRLRHGVFVAPGAVPGGAAGLAVRRRTAPRSAVSPRDTGHRPLIPGHWQGVAVQPGHCYMLPAIPARPAGTVNRPKGDRDGTPPPTL